MPPKRPKHIWAKIGQNWPESAIRAMRILRARSYFQLPNAHQIIMIQKTGKFVICATRLNPTPPCTSGANAKKTTKTKDRHKDEDKSSLPDTPLHLGQLVL